jgi:glycosyltransferase involved in cell wall biosynthesis
MTPSRVLLVTDYSGRSGGVELLIERFRHLLADRGMAVAVAASDIGLEAADNPPDYLFRGSEGPARALREVANLSAVRAVGAALERFRPDLAHIFMFMTQASPLILRALRSVPVVYTVNTYRVVCPTGSRLLPDGRICAAVAGTVCLREKCLSLKGWLPRMAQLRLLARTVEGIDVRVATSADAAERLAQAGFPVDAVAHFGVPAAPPAGLPSGSPVIGFSGRLVREKGAAVLLEAFAIVRRTQPGAKLVVIGEGPEGAVLAERAGRPDLAGAVELAGHRPRAEAEAAMAAAHIQVVPSLWPEPFGLVTAEAMMRATPVVASDVGASPELLGFGARGVLTRAGDPAALAAGIAGLIADPARARALAGAGRRHAKRELSEGAMIGRYLEIYRRAMDIHRGVGEAVA